MSFQGVVNINQSIGEPGDLYSDQPRRIVAGNILSASAANNVYGRAFTINQVIDLPPEFGAGQPGSRPYGGILVNSKSQAAFGVSGNPLAPTMTLPNGAIGQFCTMGQVIVNLEISPPATAGVAQMGDLVIFENATGKLTSIPPGTALPANYSYAYANIFLPISPAPTFPALCVITLTPPTVADQTSVSVLT